MRLYKADVFCSAHPTAEAASHLSEASMRLISMNHYSYIKFTSLNQSTTGSANSGFISIAAFGIGKYL